MNRLQMGFDALPTMGSILPDREFPCLQTTKKVSFRIDSGLCDPTVPAGFYVSPVTPNFTSEFCKGVVGKSASTLLCSEGLISAEPGCQRVSADCDTVDVVPVGILDAPDLRPVTAPADSVWVNTPGIFPGCSSPKPDLCEQGVTPLASVVDCVPLGTHGELNHQSPHRKVSNGSSSVAHLGFSLERGVEHMGPSWSSVVTKNTLGGHVSMGGPIPGDG